MNKLCSLYQEFELRLAEYQFLLNQMDHWKQAVVQFRKELENNVE